MARIKGLKQLFTTRQVANVLEQFEKDIEDKALQTLQYLGEEFVNKARLLNTYKDNTGNLRASIGYIIIHNGKVIDANFKGKNTGKQVGNKFAKHVALSYPNGWVLIGVAGMAYAAYVEAKNYDVITGSAPTSNDLKSIFNEIIN